MIEETKMKKALDSIRNNYLVGISFIKIAEKLIVIKKKVMKFTLSVNAFSSLKNLLAYLCEKTPASNNFVCFQ